MVSATRLLRQCPRLTDEQILELLEGLKPSFMEALRGILEGDQIHTFGGDLEFHAMLKQEGRDDQHADVSLNLLVVMAAEPFAGPLIEVLKGVSGFLKCTGEVEPEEEHPESTHVG